MGTPKAICGGNCLSYIKLERRKPIIMEAIIGLVTAFDIKADVLVSLALIESVIIGKIFAAGEVAFIMQLGALLEDLTVAKARAGIEKLVHLTPRTARRIFGDNVFSGTVNQFGAFDMKATKIYVAIQNGRFYCTVRYA